MADDRTGTDRRAELDMVREIATHASDIRHLQENMDKMLESMKIMQQTLVDINLTLSEARGGWKMLMLLGGAGGLFGSLITQFVHSLPPWGK